MIPPESIQHIQPDLPLLSSSSEPYRKRSTSPSGSFPKVSASATQNLTDFLEHGKLPFVGRQRLRDRLFNFWKSIEQGGGLHAGVMVGERGIGKSRLLSEVIPQVRREGGVVVPIKLYHGTMTSIVPLLARALATVARSTRLLREKPEENLGAIVENFCRLLRLRPTLFVVEDADHLNSDSMRELGTLIEALCGETGAFLFVTRPADTAIQSVAEPYLVERIRLPGLNEEEIAELWERLFEATPKPEIVPALREATAGNPLALRVVLRGAVESEIRNVTATRTDAFPTAISPSGFSAALRRNIQRLSEGMTAHLTPMEQQAVSRLAWLGEVAARESAACVLDDPEQTIRALLFKGVLVTVEETAVPLPGERSEQPLLTFASSVILKGALPNGEPDAGRVLRLVAEGSPLYSIQPFHLLKSKAEELGVAAPLSTLRAAVSRALVIADILAEGVDRGLGMSVWEAGKALLSAGRARWSEDEYRTLYTQFLSAKLRIVEGSIDREEEEKLFHEVIDRTADADSIALMSWRLRVLVRPGRMDHYRNYEELGEAWREAERIIERFPEIRFDLAYATFLSKIAGVASSIDETWLLRNIERRCREILAVEHLPSGHRRYLEQHVLGYLLLLFDSTEELQERTDWLEMLERSNDDAEVPMAFQKISLLALTGRFREAEEICRQTVSRLENEPSPQHYYRCLILREALATADGANLEELAERVRRLTDEAGTALTFRHRISIATMMAMTGVLRGEPEWTRRIVLYLVGDERYLNPEVRPLVNDDSSDDLIQRIIGEESRDAEATDALLYRRIPRQIVSLRDILRIHFLLSWLKGSVAAEKRLLKKTEWKDALRLAVGKGAEWLLAHALPAYVEPLLDAAAELVPTKERTRLLSSMHEMKTQHRKESATGQTGVSVVGSISVQLPGDDQPTAVRGVRQRTLLALMVIDRMLERPLEREEFNRIAVAGVESPEYARKLLNNTVWRLREVLGADAVLTDGAAPRLNPEVVSVDLLHVRGLLATARKALIDGTLMRVVPALMEALEVIGNGGVLFEGLYDRFFEAARDDFEYEFRTVILEAAHRLLEEGDVAGSERLLRRGMEIMPGDEEVEELLCRNLISRGKRVEAERIRGRRDMGF